MAENMHVLSGGELEVAACNYNIYCKICLFEARCYLKSSC